MRGFERKLRTNYTPREGETLNKTVFEKMKDVFNKGTPRVAPSGANPSNLVGKEIDVEDDVLHIKKLPDFGGYITAHKAELLIQYLTVPYLRIPLVMQFFSSQEHTKALVREELQDILDCCLFEPAAWRPPEELEVPDQVPARTRAHLLTPAGLLLNELQKSPTNIMRALDEMLEHALELDTGRFLDASSPVILYMIRLAVRIQGYMLRIINHANWKTGGQTVVGVRGASHIRGLECDPSVVDQLVVMETKLRTQLFQRAFPILESWIKRAVKSKDNAVLCVLWSHAAYVFKNIRVSDKALGSALRGVAASTLLSAQMFLTASYRFDAEPTVSTASSGRDRSGSKAHMSREAVASLGISQTELFDLFTTHRVDMLEWLSSDDVVCNEAMEAAVRVVTNTGGRKWIADGSKFIARTWKSMVGRGQRGRFVPDSKKLDNEGKEIEDDEPEENYASFEDWLRLTSNKSVDTEINVQLGEFTLKKHRVEPLPAQVRFYATHCGLI